MLEPVVNDLSTLAQEGVVVNRPDGSVTLKGTLVAVVADNLAAHAIGGCFNHFLPAIHIGFVSFKEIS